MMKLSTISTVGAVLLPTGDAFGTTSVPVRPSTTRLDLIPGPSLVSSAIVGSTSLTASAGVELSEATVGGGSFYDMFHSKLNITSPNEFKHPEELASATEKTEVTSNQQDFFQLKVVAPEPEVTEAQSFFFGFGKKKEVVVVAPQTAKATTISQEEVEKTEKVIAEVKKQGASKSKEKLSTKSEAQSSFFGFGKKKEVVAVTPQTAKATTMSQEEIEKTEKVIAEVKKQAASETKEKLSTKSEEVKVSSPPPPEPVEETPVAVAEKRIEGGVKRKLVKGTTLIVVAGLVVVARNLVQAYLGRGLL